MVDRRYPMARRQHDELFHPGNEESVAFDEKPSGMTLNQTREGRG